MSWPNDTAVPLPWAFAPTDPNSTAVGGTYADYAANYAEYARLHPAASAPSYSWWDYVPHTPQGFAVAPFTGPFALGSWLNRLTGGHSPTWSPVAAVQGGSTGTTYSNTTRWASGYSGNEPGGGEWRLPVLNDAGLDVAGDVVADVLPPWALPAAIGIGAIFLLR